MTADPTTDILTSTTPTEATLLSGAPWRDGGAMHAILDRIAAATTRPWNIMEVCGGQTFTLSRYRIEGALPPLIRMIHGPGCPVCVTSESTIDAAIGIAMRPGVIFCSFGDMLRVPGTRGSLLAAKAAGADIRLLYSPLDTLAIAAANPASEVVFFAIGFETTTPLYALLAERAAAMRITNLSLLTSLYTVPAAVRAIKSDPECSVDALIAAGHVCAITGLEEYEALSRELDMPIVVGGFEPADMLLAIAGAVEMLEQGRTGVENAYGRVVSRDGNPRARASVDRVFEPCDIRWRGIGVIGNSGRRLRRAYEQFDAATRFSINPDDSERSTGCVAAMIMKGKCSPADCPHFGRSCTPTTPVGAPMVSGEGVCAAYWRYRR